MAKNKDNKAKSNKNSKGGANMMENNHTQNKQANQKGTSSKENSDQYSG